MKEYKLNIGELQVNKQEDVTYTCLGLGSCIGLFIQDRSLGLSGGAHILLSQSSTPDSTGKFLCAKSAINELISRFRSMGSTLANLRAKITGGAHVISTGMQVGKENVEHVMQELIANRVYVAAIDVGGNKSRTARFNSQSGTMTIRIPDTNEYKIY